MKSNKIFSRVLRLRKNIEAGLTHFMIVVVVIVVVNEHRVLIYQLFNYLTEKISEFKNIYLYYIKLLSCRRFLSKKEICSRKILHNSHICLFLVE